MKYYHDTDKMKAADNISDFVRDFVRKCNEDSKKDSAEEGGGGPVHR